jgi:outer membrane protein assembly factor BamB
MKVVSAIFVMLTSAAVAEDWPTYQHDNRRSGVTSESLAFPLREVWRYESPVPPQAAWAGPAKWDAYSPNEGLQSMRNFDPAFFVTVAGDALYFGSSVDHAAHCLEAATGEERWVCFTNGAVRLPPTIDGTMAFLGSDDGYAYGVDTATGRKLWKRKASPDPRMIPSDGKLLSPWPVRSGVMVRDGMAYFAASLFPWEPSYLCAVEAATGSSGGEGCFVSVEKGITLQGALLASSDALYAPQGRSVPMKFGIADGKKEGGVTGSGGIYCVLTEEEQFIAMPANQKEREDTIRITGRDGGEALLSFSGVDRLLVAGRLAYYHQGGELKAVDRFALQETQARINGWRAEQKRQDETRKAIEGQIAQAKAALAPASEGGPPPSEEQRAALEMEIAGYERQLVPIDEGSTNRRADIATAEKGKATCQLWSTKQPHPFGMMFAGGNLFIGGSGAVRAINGATGETVWSIDIVGKAYGLAVSGGRLFVSTDRGHILAFAP